MYSYYDRNTYDRSGCIVIIVVPYSIAKSNNTSFKKYVSKRISCIYIFLL